MKRVTMVGVLLVASLLSACGSAGSKASASTTQEADKYEISQLQVRWHEANSTKNLDEAMNLFADDAVFTVGGRTSRGKDEIRRFLATAAPFNPENHWTSLHPAFKVRITVAKDRGTLHFECHFVDIDSKQFKASTSADAKVARIKGQWVFTSLVGSNATLD